MKRLMALLMIVTFALSGCLGLGVAPDTIAQKLVVADREFSAVLNTASDLREAGILDDESMRDLNPLVQKTNKYIDAAWTAYDAGKMEKANNRLIMVNKLLMEVRTILQKQQGDE